MTNKILFEAACRSGYLVTTDSSGREDEQHWLERCSRIGIPAIILDSVTPALRVTLPHATAEIAARCVRRQFLRAARHHLIDVQIQIGKDQLVISLPVHREVSRLTHEIIAAFRAAGMLPGEQS